MVGFAGYIENMPIRLSGRIFAFHFCIASMPLQVAYCFTRAGTLGLGRSMTASSDKQEPVMQFDTPLNSGLDGLRQPAKRHDPIT